MKYLLETPVRGTIGTENFKTSIYWRNGVLTTDEPEKLGGKDLGPDPYTLLLSSLVSCTLATLRMYIDHKALALNELSVKANMVHKIGNDGAVIHIERSIEIGSLSDPDIRERLIRVAENCPISKILKGRISIATELT